MHAAEYAARRRGASEGQGVGRKHDDGHPAIFMAIATQGLRAK